MKVSARNIQNVLRAYLRIRVSLAESEAEFARAAKLHGGDVNKAGNDKGRNVLFEWIGNISEHMGPRISDIFRDLSNLASHMEDERTGPLSISNGERLVEIDGETLRALCFVPKAQTEKSPAQKAISPELRKEMTKRPGSAPALQPPGQRHPRK